MAKLYAQRSFWEKVGLHSCFWLAIYLCFAYVDGGYDQRYLRAAINEGVHIPAKIAFMYSVIYYLFPRFLYKRKYTSFYVLLVLFLLLAGIAFRLLQGYITLSMYRPPLPFTPFDASRFLWAVLEVSFPAMIAASIKLFKARYESARITQQLENAALTAELKFLKAQISPHFLFNTLNNIYGLSLMQSPQVPDAILKLSGLLRFVLKSGNSGHITLQEELDILDNYIALERLRYGERLSLRFGKEIDNPRSIIAPLILLSLVENSFKHGISESLSHPYIYINVKVKAGILHFSIENSKEQSIQEHKNGIGLSNVQRQLELTYGKHYGLDIREEASAYHLKLNIHLQAL